MVWVRILLLARRQRWPSFPSILIPGQSPPVTSLSPHGQGSNNTHECTELAKQLGVEVAGRRFLQPTPFSSKGCWPSAPPRSCQACLGSPHSFQGSLLLPEHQSPLTASPHPHQLNCHSWLAWRQVQAGRNLKEAGNLGEMGLLSGSCSLVFLSHRSTDGSDEPTDVPQGLCSHRWETQPSGEVAAACVCMGIPNSIFKISNAAGEGVWLLKRRKHPTESLVIRRVL